MAEENDAWGNWLMMLAFVIILYFLAKPFVAKVQEKLQEKSEGTSMEGSWEGQDTETHTVSAHAWTSWGDAPVRFSRVTPDRVGTPEV